MSYLTLTPGSLEAQTQVVLNNVVCETREDTPQVLMIPVPNLKDSFVEPLPETKPVGMISRFFGWFSLARFSSRSIEEGY